MNGEWAVVDAASCTMREFSCYSTLSGQLNLVSVLVLQQSAWRVVLLALQDSIL